MRMVELIQKKRNGLVLSPEEIRFIIRGYVQGSIPDYQMSALTMAIYYKGMTAEETAELTMAMAQSGDQVELSFPGKTFVDKHSSGGVGDKTTLIVGPMVAACGVPVAKMSGRGLGHTGGTIDKLSSIPGFQVEMKQKDFLEQVNRIGLSVTAQTGNLVPADKKLYALRDVTATVDSIPLIASSIMSKKIASGARGIVLDVKYGSGAFTGSLKEAKILAKTMVRIGRNLGRETVAILSNMDQPLGKAVGNSLEVLEAVNSLQGNGPADLMEVSYELASWMLVLGKKAKTRDEARKILEENVEKGRAWQKFLEFVEAQGGNTAAVANKQFTLAPIRLEVKAEKNGFIHNQDARVIGICAMNLGAGRETKESSIDLGAGICLEKKSGDYVRKGETVFELYTSNAEKAGLVADLLKTAVRIKDQPVSHKPIVAQVILK
ncbi:MAG: Pyrimidine-nucleoside phosphorylase [Candidatus Dichloromethanomonas elyunquensis]|nr:MAG: Pyrimidine-nucleoside phosphorylase [Candidatus Dichloromethanomonas elyunquensis]